MRMPSAAPIAAVWRPIRPKPTTPNRPAAQFNQRSLPEAPIRVLRPLAVAHRFAMQSDVMAQLQQQSDRELRNRGGAVRGNIA